MAMRMTMVVMSVPMGVMVVVMMVDRHSGNLALQ